MPRLCWMGAGVGLAPVLGVPVYPTGSSSVFSHVLVPLDGDPEHTVRLEPCLSYRSPQIWAQQ